MTLLLVFLLFAPALLPIIIIAIGMYHDRNKKYTQQEIEEITMLGASQQHFFNE